MRLTVLSYCLLCALLAIGGCGIKPGQLDPPPGSKPGTFPKTYPAPDTNP